MPGDTIIVKDSRATIGSSGPIPYALGGNATIIPGTVTLTPAEFPVADVSGGSPGGSEISDWALPVLLTSAGQSISAQFCYIDPDSRGGGQANVYWAVVTVSGLATVR